MAKSHTFYQRGLKGGRPVAKTKLDPKQKAFVEREMAKFGASESFVLNTLVSFVSGIPLMFDTYQQAAARPTTRKKTTKKRRAR
jgi:hypothetical protein